MVTAKENKRIMKMSLVLQLLQNMGARYVSYRAQHEFEKRFGILRKKHPINPPLKSFVTLDAWRKNTPSFVIAERELLTFPKEKKATLKDKFERVSNGEIYFFGHEWKNIGLDYDWITNPDSGYRYDVSKHWSEISDLNPTNGDIKYVWEKSRFSYLLTIIRYDYHFDEDYAEFVFSEIESWIAANPINQGPNWRCSQEISLRIFNWCYALTFYKNSDALTEDRWLKIQHVIYWSLHHVYHHINFSRIAVRNNHAITETLCLTLSNLLFPFIPETKKWSMEGKRWFEQEVDYQIYSDGTFLQFSMNYHRVIIQLLTLGINVYHKNNQSFSKVIYDKAYKSLNFLFQCLQCENGWLPNYGSNDGALFFPFTESDYRDYRPQLNSLHYCLTGKDLFEEINCLEDKSWVNAEPINLFDIEALVQKQGTQSFEVGGFYLCRNNNYFTMIRCGNHKDRPAQADNLHVDIWCKGKNILRDSGTYKYNTDSEKLYYFMGSLGHNVVMVDNHSQMLKGGRFIWYYWSQANYANWDETENEFIFEGEINAFKFLNSKAAHKRKIIISKHEPKWVVEDEVGQLNNLLKRQIWHSDSNHLQINSDQTKAVLFDSYNSDYYGQYDKTKSLYFEFSKKIKTTLKYTIH